MKKLKIIARFFLCLCIVWVLIVFITYADLYFNGWQIYSTAGGETTVTQGEKGFEAWRILHREAYTLWEAFIPFVAAPVICIIYTPCYIIIHKKLKKKEKENGRN
jgi:hypothetical protein